MSSSPKIIVLKMREIIYTVVLLFLIILLILCMILMFLPKQTESNLSETTSEAAYSPGIYTEPITLGDSTIDVEVTVDSDHINGIRLVNLSETAAASYPLLSPSLEHIASQILEKQGLDEITSPNENRYTAQILLSAISNALAHATLSQN